MTNPGTDWPRMLQSPDGDAGAIARQLDLTETRVRRALEELAECQARFSGLVATRAGSHADHLPAVQLLAGSDTVRSRIGELAGSCEVELCSFTPPGGDRLITASREAEAGAIDRGVRVRTVLADSARYDLPTREYATWLVEYGGEVRTVPALPLPMLIVDWEMAVVPDTADGGDVSAVVLSIGPVLEALRALFRTTWKVATPVGSVRRRDENGLSAQAKQVLRLLGEGRTDEAISRRLGVSVRTARRVACDLLARLGARSRFQAGALAMARGWIDESDLV